MEKRIKKIFFVALSIGLFCLPENSSAALPFSTSFDCSEWQENGAYSCPCSDMCSVMYQPQANHQTTDGHLSMVTNGGICPFCGLNHPDANNPLGSGKGFRKFFGNDSSILGGNDASGGLHIDFGEGVSELWIRFYIRIASDFAATSATQHKIIYFYSASGAVNYFDISPGSYNQYRYAKQTGYAQFPNSDATDVVYHDGYIVQGAWQCVELHIKSESGYGVFDGTYECWIDGSLVYSDSSQYHGFYNSSNILLPWTYVVIPHNTHISANEPDSYIDYDDIAISKAGYIGTLGSVEETSPESPNGLSVN